LRDTAGSISVFTKEFLDDVMITDVSELVQYSVNAEMNTNENQAGSNQNPVVNAQSIVQPILIRGMAASLGMDYSPASLRPIRIEWAATKTAAARTASFSASVRPAD
jgi:hypothetical protein